MLAALKNAKRVVGINQLTRSIEADRVETVFIANDAEPRVISPLLVLCAQKGLTPERVATMRELGVACGINVGAAAAGLLKEE